MPTYATKLKTDSGMPPQFRTLEAPAADTPTGGPKRAGAFQAVRVHGREERSARSSHLPARGEMRLTPHAENHIRIQSPLSTRRAGPISSSKTNTRDSSPTKPKRLVGVSSLSIRSTTRHQILGLGGGHVQEAS